MEVKTLHDHLVHGRVNALQEKLNLKEWLGFANGDFEYSNSDWDSYEDYEDFVSDASTYPSLVGCVEGKGNSLNFETTIILYARLYYVQVEVSKLGDTKSSCLTGVFKDYLDALQFAYKVVKKGGQTNANEGLFIKC
jgi:hypothetical protein